METDATVDSSITSSSRVNKRVITPYHYSSVHSPELPCAGIEGRDPLSFGPKFPEILVESIAPLLSSTLRRRFLEFLIADSDFAFDFGLLGRLVRCSNSHMLANFLKALDDVGHPYLSVKLLFS